MLDLEKIYPLHPSHLQRHFIMRHFKPLVEKMCESNNHEERRAGLELRQLLVNLEESKGEEKVIYESLIRDIKARSQALKIKYAALKVSKRTFQIVELDFSSSFSSQWVIGDPFDKDAENETIAFTKAHPITKRVSYQVAKKIYCHLALGQEIPEDLTQYLLEEED